MTPREGQQEYVIMCPSSDSLSYYAYRHIRNVLWGSGIDRLYQVIRRAHPTHMVLTVCAANQMFPNVGDWSKLKA